MSVVNRPRVAAPILSFGSTINPEAPRVLLIGQMLSSGTAAEGLVQDIQDDGAWDGLFGANSMLASAIRVFRTYNKVSPLDVYAYDDVSEGVAADATITFTGTTTAAGSLYVTVGSRRKHRILVDIASGDAPTAIATKVVNAVNASTPRQVVASSSLGVVTLASLHKGVEGNNYTVQVEGTVAGTSYEVTAFADGATNPTLTGLVTAIDGLRYHYYAAPASYDLSALITNLKDQRLNAQNVLLDGRLIQIKVDTASNFFTLLDSLNNQCYEPVLDLRVADDFYKGGVAREYPLDLSAYLCAVRALRLTRGTDVSPYVLTAGAPNDAFGGPHLASKPLFNTPLLLVDPIVKGKGLTASQQDTLLAKGGSSFGNNRTYTSVILMDVATTYKTDPAGNADPTFKFAEANEQASIAREYFMVNTWARFGQARLTEGTVFRGYSMANADVVRAFVKQLRNDLAQPEYLITEAGEAAEADFDKNLTVTIVKATGTIRVTCKLVIVVQARRFEIPLSFALQVGNNQVV